MSLGRCRESWVGVTVVRKCGSNEGGVKYIRKVCQLIERCDVHGGDVRGYGEV